MQGYTSTAVQQPIYQQQMIQQPYQQNLNNQYVQPMQQNQIIYQQPGMYQNNQIYAQQGYSQQQPIYVVGPVQQQPVVVAQKKKKIIVVVVNLMMMNVVDWVYVWVHYVVVVCYLAIINYFIY